MANFHAECLAIAANEENMCKVLVRFAQNLAANSEDTKFDLSSIEGLTTVRDLWRVISIEIEAYYWLGFAGAPIDREIADAGSEEWGAHQENRAYLSSIEAAFGRLTSQTDSDNVKASVSYAPTARPMSDAAVAICDLYGDNWVVAISYDTAWESNSNDLNLFFTGLPEGSYGVAFLDADEYDGYESVGVFAGLHHGRAGMRAILPHTDKIMQKEDLKNKRAGLSRALMLQIADLAELAEDVAICEWDEYRWDEDEWDEDADGGEADGYSYNGYDPLASWGYSINWDRPSDADLERVDEAVLAVLARFPWVVGSTGAAYEGRESNVERLVPGQPIKIVADWANPYFQPCAIQTQDAKGCRLGNLDDRGGGMDLSENARSALACILPHVRAFADKVEPLMILNGRKRNSTVIIRLELTDEPLEHVLDEAHELLGRASNQRTVSSVVEED